MAGSSLYYKRCNESLEMPRGRCENNDTKENGKMKALLCKCMLLSMWLAVHMAHGATASVVSFTASEPDENGSVQLDWVVTGSPYAGGIRFNVAVSRSETNDLMTSTIITGVYMDQRNSVRGSLVDTPPVAGKTYYYWLNCAPYNSSFYNNFAYLWLNGEYDRIHNSSPYGPITVHIPAPALTLSVETADWSEGSITFRCKDDDAGETKHSYTLSYEDENGVYVDVEGATDVASGEEGDTELKDMEFSTRLGGIPAVKYKVRDENGRESSECETRHRYALCVGIDKYYDPEDPTSTEDDLTECVNDATEWKNLFESRGKFDVSPLVTDGNATKSRILANLAACADKVEPGDIFVYTHSSHGGEGVLCSHVIDESGDITAGEFASALRGFPKGTGLIVILDACYSGGIPNGLRKRSQMRANRLLAAEAAVGASFAESVIAEMNAANAKNVKLRAAGNSSQQEKISSGDEVGWLTAVNDSQLSLDGVFSQMCLQTAGWKHGRADSNVDWKVSFLELGDFAVEYLRKVYDDFGMTPKVLSSDILANVCAGDVDTYSLHLPITDAPTGVTASTNRNDRITVQWNSVPNATFYWVTFKPLSPNGETERVYGFWAKATEDDGRSAELTEIDVDVLEVADSGETEWVPKRRDLKPGDRFSIHVRAYNPMYAGPASANVDGVAVLPTIIADFAMEHWQYSAPSPVNPVNPDGTINYDNLNLDHDGDGLTSLQECIAGCNPLDSTSTFYANVEVVEGNPNVTWSPKLSGQEESKRRYTILGRESLSGGDSGWVDMEQVSSFDRRKYRFFKVRVDLR